MKFSIWTQANISKSTLSMQRMVILLNHHLSGCRCLISSNCYNMTADIKEHVCWYCVMCIEAGGKKAEANLVYAGFLSLSHLKCAARQYPTLELYFHVNWWNRFRWRQLHNEFSCSWYQRNTNDSIALVNVLSTRCHLSHWQNCRMICLVLW